MSASVQGYWHRMRRARVSTQFHRVIPKKYWLSFEIYKKGLDRAAEVMEEEER